MFQVNKGKVLAIILAGGNGTRMGALTHHRAKPILPFGASCRVIDFTLTNCLRSGVRDICALVDYQKQSTSDYLSKWSLTNSMGDELKILEPRNGHYLGTADAVRQNLPHIKKAKPDLVMILAADHIYKMDFRGMLDFHTSKKADVTLAIKEVPMETASLFGIVNLNHEGEITDFTEKPAMPLSNLASMGIYIFNTDMLLEQLENGVIQPAASLDFGRDIIPSLIKDKRVMAYKYSGYWRDIGTIDSYFGAHMDLLSNPPLVSVDGVQPVLTDSISLQPQYINEGKNIYNSIVSPSCRIEGKVQNSILAHGVCIKYKAVVRNSIIMSNAEIGEYSVVDHSILDQNVKVDRSCYVGKPGRYNDKYSITVIEKDAHLSSYDALLLTYRSSFPIRQEAVANSISGNI